MEGECSLDLAFLFREDSPEDSPAGGLRAELLETRVSSPLIDAVSATGPLVLLPLKLRLPKHENLAALSANLESPENASNGGELITGVA